MKSMFNMYSMYGYWVEIVLILSGIAVLALGISLFFLIRQKSKTFRTGIAMLAAALILCIPAGIYLNIHGFDRLWHWYRYERPVVRTMPKRAYEETSTGFIWYSHHVYTPMNQKDIAVQELELSDAKAYIENDNKGLTEMPLYEAKEKNGQIVLCVGDDKRQFYCRKEQTGK